MISCSPPPSTCRSNVLDMILTLACSDVGTRLDDASLRIAVALRLSASICAPHKCICGVDVDSSGVHGLSCRKSAGRHSTLNDLVKRALTSAEVSSRLELTSMSRSDGKRPNGLTMMPRKQDRCMVWDVACPFSWCNQIKIANISYHVMKARTNAV